MYHRIKVKYDQEMYGQNDEPGNLPLHLVKKEHDRETAPPPRRVSFALDPNASMFW